MQGHSTEPGERQQSKADPYTGGDPAPAAITGGAHPRTRLNPDPEAAVRTIRPRNGPSNVQGSFLYCLFKYRE